jgi:hypothetical protein
MKRHNTGALDPVQKDCDVARPVYDFRVFTNDIWIDIPKELPTAVAAPSAEDCANLRTPKHLEKFAEPALPRSREVAK